jgi:hypothetical protein
MEEDPLMEFVEPDRQCVTHEMDFVAEIGELFAEFCRDDTAAAICWITGNSYFQRKPPFTNALNVNSVVANPQMNHGITEFTEKSRYLFLSVFSVAPW